MSTFLELQRNHHSLGLYCMHCNRWGIADLRFLIDSGRGNSLVSGARFRCQDCGQVVEKQVRPPAPSLGNTTRYI